jgi:hypothetical protein
MLTAPGRPEQPAGATNTNAPPVESPFEIPPTTEAQKLAALEAFLDVPPFELIPGADDLPDAAFVDDDEAPEAPVSGAAAAKAPPSAPPAAPPPPKVVPPPAPVATFVPPPPVAAIVPPAPPATYVPPPPPTAPPPPPSAVTAPRPAVAPPAAPPATPPPPPAAPRLEDLPEAPIIPSEPSLDLPPPKPDPPPKPKGCPYCGVEGTYNLHARSPLGILLMLFGTLGGVASLILTEEDRRYGIAAGVCFLAAIIGAFLKRWTIICAGCERRRY